MYTIVERQDLLPKVHLLKIQAPKVAAAAAAGQFVILRIDAEGERFPLTIADWDVKAGTVTVIYMEIGASTRKLAKLGAGDAILDFAGPLGKPTEIENFGTVVCVSGGFAMATIVPIARAMKEAGNRVISVVGARSKDLFFWHDRLEKYSDEMIVCTDDGSAGIKGVVTEPLRDLLASSTKVDRVIVIGPSVMMKFCSKTTQPFGVKTIVSLNPIMIDGTGMCGCCRVSLDGQTRFACVDGPEFDGHKVDWDGLLVRQKSYVAEEAVAAERCRCKEEGCGNHG
ncbi:MULTISPECIES: sulfide/dihydroorotate dehydrogenase-like FAD/NAD-binding protein [Dehalococcoides]|jgi:ferredoxin--NADP+ reductase|uniref:GltD-like oxidoreductase, FAD/NAD(P)-binding, PyrK n=1 Tax=Dehalococcoides mccartyi (strain VS) TaxID=311424 RepID=D2BK02_DEHMV|nr:MULTISPECIES: sulfide/dihydroorotate dehydrogenase-like FAD/NAD-binding protein [Dehalococcoides]ACZ61214.1 GltD-like oxidoreductase, FAD/NAD(P)-binding, PyrK [Dehalococcoides mccartyi VS]AHB12825.1 ferredoxin NADP+ reductase [Dehalococcoides mccartyi GY50]QYY58618.1 sulfide/dihydroorotate dehydrogenase-like FAD/NAD-binding protein [Dehalococcoides mccartyi]BAQ33993.1 putative sulfide dehydrogenase subunit SudB [Dehalococcoides sp. UCH007]